MYNKGETRQTFPALEKEGGKEGRKEGGDGCSIIVIPTSTPAL